MPGHAGSFTVETMQGSCQSFCCDGLALALRPQNLSMGQEGSHCLHPQRSRFNCYKIPLATRAPLDSSLFVFQVDTACLLACLTVLKEAHPRSLTSAPRRFAHTARPLDRQHSPFRPTAAKQAKDRAPGHSGASYRSCKLNKTSSFMAGLCLYVLYCPPCT